MNEPFKVPPGIAFKDEVAAWTVIADVLHPLDPQHRVRAIAITGEPCSGKTKLALALAEWVVPGLGGSTYGIRRRRGEDDWQRLLRDISEDFAEVPVIDNVAGKIRSQLLLAYLRADVWEYRMKYSHTRTKALRSKLVIFTGCALSFSDDFAEQVRVIELLPYPRFVE